MKKYEITQKIFHQLLHDFYEPFDIPFANDLMCTVTPDIPKINQEKNYLGSIALRVEVVQNGVVKNNYQLQADFIQNHAIPSLEDQAGGYAFRIRSSKSELVFRAMQAALYDYQDEMPYVHLYSDLDSKKGDKTFLQQMKKWILQYTSMWESWGGKLLPSDQFLFLTFDTTGGSIVQSAQNVIQSAVFIALLKGVLKREILMSLSTDYKMEQKEPSHVWKISPGEKASSWTDALENQEIFVGWPELGNLNQYKSRDELMKAYKKTYNPEQEPIRNVFTLWSFYHDVKPGDIVIANRGWKQFVGIGKVTGDYEYRQGTGDYPNRRKVEWIISEEVHFDQNVFSTPTLTPVHLDKLVVIQKEVTSQVSHGEEKWRSIFGDWGLEPQQSFINDFDHFMRSRQFHFTKEFITRFITSLQTKPFVILSGISGTGKTKIAQLFTDYMNSGSDKKDKKGNADTTQSVNNENKQFKLTVQPYYLQYNRMIVPQEIMEWIELDNVENGVEIDLKFNGQIEKALMKKTKRGYVRLGFRKEFTNWFRGEFQAGDEILFTIFDDGATIFFDRFEQTPDMTENNMAFLSVRPDWLDHRGLLGFYNPLTESYETTPLLKTMLEATQNPNKPYFVVLDEMNLAKVEYYFSDFLSCIESRRLNDKGELVQEAILLHNQPEELLFVDQRDKVYSIPANIEIPYNLYIIGTVNIDETTYMFSPKVLDRANVIEFNELDIERYWNDNSDESSYTSPYTLNEKVEWFTTEAEFHYSLYKKEYRLPEWREEMEQPYTVLIELHRLLEEEGYSFGYRAIDEIMNYIMLNSYFEYGTTKDALDAQIIQKILPKLHGNRKQVEDLLRNIIRYTIGDHLQTDLLTEEEKEVLEYEEFYRYPLSGKKAYRMYKQLMKTGYCSYIS